MNKNKHLKNKILCILATLLIFVFTLTSCAKCIGTETSTVQVKVTDEYYMAAYTTMYYNPATKTMLPMSHPADYRIIIEYNGVEYNFYDSDTYEKYSDRIGEYVNGTLEIRKYDDGTIRYNIVELE